MGHGLDKRLIRQSTLRVDTWLLNALKKRGLGASHPDRAMICTKIHLEMPVVVFRAYCALRDKIFYGVTTREYYYTDSKDFIFKVVLGDSPFSKEVDILGSNEFEFSPIATFRNVQSAMVYKEFLVNKCLDSNIGCYNPEFDTHPFTRHITIAFKETLLEEFMETCYKKNKTVNQAIKRMVTSFNRRNK